MSKAFCAAYILMTFIFRDLALMRVTKMLSTLLKRLGFDIISKSNVIPSQKIKHLGFLFDSRPMTVSLGPDEKKNIQEIILHILYTDRSMSFKRLALK